ncbi:MAG TPA: dockerin type I domain-containing protein [candidate division Zixibacteria bacterium]|nr:dockerin type I domain-containing protein [candidate division Zixibacteria bacterium]
MFMASSGWGTTRLVPSQFTSIQAAIETASDGDTVLISDGIYLQKIDFAGKNVVVGSHYIIDSNPTHIEWTVIDADSGAVEPASQGATVNFSNGEGPGARLIGLTVRGGLGNEDVYSFGRKGGGIYIRDAAPRIEHCLIRNNYASTSGGGAYCSGDPIPLFSNCRFIENLTAFFGGGIEIDLCSPMIVDCEFRDNSAGKSLGIGGGLDIWQGDPTIIGCWFIENIAYAGGGVSCYAGNMQMSNSLLLNNEAWFGGGLYAYGLDPVVTQCTFFGNRGDQTGGGVYIEGCHLILNNSIIAYSENGVGLAEYVSNSELNCCDLYGNIDGDWVGSIAVQADLNGNQWTDPLFCDAVNEDFTLDAMSSCLPDNNDCMQRIGAYGAGCEGALKMQITPFPFSVVYANAVDTMMATIVIGNFTAGYSLLNLDLSSIRINDSLVPDSIYSLPAYEYFIGEVLVLRETMKSLLASYPIVWDTTLAEYRVTGLFNDKADLDLVALVPILGRATGDFNLDGSVDISDVIAMVTYYFSGGEPPADMTAVDMNHDGRLDITDLLALVERLFSERLEPPGLRVR